MAKAKRNKKPTPKAINLQAYFLAGAVCIVIPLLHFQTTIDPVLYPRFLGWSILSITLLLSFWLSKSKTSFQISIFKNGYFISLGAFILASILSLALAYNPIEGLTDLMKWILVWIFSALVLQILLSDKNALNILLKGMVVFAFLITLIGFYQYLNKAINNSDPNALYEVKGLMAHKNQLSFSLFLGIPFLWSAIVMLEKGWKKAGILATVSTLILITILQTRAVWIAMGFSISITGIVLLFNNKKTALFTIHKKWIIRSGIVFVVIIIFSVLIGIIFPEYNPVKKVTSRVSTIFDPEFTSNQWRVEMWDATYRMVKDNPVTGVGGGNWKISIYPYYGRYLPSVFRHWRTPHNDYLSILSEKGILGLAGVLAIFIFLFFYGIKNTLAATDRKTALFNGFFLFGISGYMIISFFSFPNERMNHLIFLSIIASVIVANYYKSIRDNQKPQFLPKWAFIPPFLILLLISIFGYQCVKSEYYIAKVQSVKDKGEFDLMEQYAKKGYFRFAPIEPRFSFPISIYQGIAEYEKKNYKEALFFFKNSYREHPTSIAVMNNLGAVYGHLGLPDSSRFYQNKTLEIFPHYELGLINLSKTFIVENDLPKAYQTILSCNPKSTNTEVMQIRQYLESKID